MYHIVFSKQALKEIKKLDQQASRFIIAWIKKNLDNCTNPRSHGKALSANKAGQWRYRIGDYRLICVIQDDELLILALSIGHRKIVYK